MNPEDLPEYVDSSHIYSTRRNSKSYWKDMNGIMR